MSEGNPVVPGGFAPGSRIAGYLLEEQIGQGGMAVVFRAHDERLDRTVALKILAPALASDEAFRQRFIRESRAAAAVDDPHIIPVFEAGEASGVLFIAMRWVRGGDVRSIVGQFGPMAPARAAEIVSQLASALDAAHGRGLVHRDVKPANMLLDASLGGGRPDHVYLSDFGLSKGSLQTSGLTGTGTFLGTLDYISPEQIEGKAVDGRADQYALACATFELLTGTPPFQRDEAMAVMYAQLSEPPPALTSRRRGLPVAADAVFFRGLAKAPADRYGSCREFSEALREAFGLRPYDSGPGSIPSGGHPVTRVVRPSDPSAAVGGAAVGGAAVGGAAGTFTAQDAGQGGYPGPGYAGEGSDPGHAAYRGQGTHQGQGGDPGPGAYLGQGADQGTYAPPDQAQGQSPGQGGPGAPPTATVLGGQDGHGGAETQLASGGGHTAPDLTAPQSQQGGPAGYSQHGGLDIQANIARPWWKSPLALVAAVVVLIAGGAAAYALTKGNGGAASTSGGGNNSGNPVVGMKAPGCSTAAAPGRKLAKPKAFPVQPGSGNPFGIAASRDGKYVFVVTDSAVQVFSTGSDGALTSTGRSYPVGSSSRPATVAVLSSDGKFLLVASDNGIQVLDAKAAENGASAGSVLLGTLTVPGRTKYGRAIGVAVTQDNAYAFVSLQFAHQVGVFNLGQALRHGNFKNAYVRSLNVGNQPVGLTLSPDGKTLYATNFVQNSPVVPGKLTVIDVNKATAPTEQNAVVSQVPAGCNPARVAVTSDNKTVWVTARQSNYLLGYSAERLRTDPAHALIAKVKVGQWPIEITLVKGGNRIVISDNDDTTTPQRAHNLAVVDPRAALAGKSALLGYIPAGFTPREFALSPDGRFMYVTNRDSAQVQVINLSTLP